MAIRITCECGKTMAVKDELAGRKVRCPQCQEVIPVPAGPSLVRATPPPLRRVEVDDEDEPAPRRRPSRDMDDEDDRPRRSAARDDDDDEPVKRKKKKKKVLVEDAPSGDGSRAASIGMGVLMMVGAVVWFVAGLYANRIFIYPPILFVTGIIAIVKGLMQSD